MKKLIVDYRISEEEKNSILKLGYNFLLCPPSKDLHFSVSGHPDMLMHILNSKNIIVHKDMPKEFVCILKDSGYNILYSNSSLKSAYPHDIILNALNISNYFVHYLDYTDTNLLNFFKYQKNFLKVKQGYTKCSTAIINDKAIITSDTGIASILSSNHIDVLLLPPGDILLPGLNYGFIGGCCGLIREDVLAFYGNLKYYKYRDEVMNFLKKHKVTPVFLREGPLIDRGSIFAI
ncbi:hypothetical protein CLHOM_14300 [Clostridium homopropionicum DSM 5847]|uniref:DUF6873 domain-containing protein n=1 Tax=Clostridium homopropionicum DSM 5847 TaxID=1121318 RepID=A0A0L6ZB90_9CLOT|nr:hypothetical protein [Clostridium homopropionicum]KOA20225.1 hypothetical protein CLHOM_14300 [Clostridium homopropionicum DSM 5847]SFG58442.1 hypothetical protein SAMN04488501_11144 [Clostridium homopropionicum]